MRHPNPFIYGRPVKGDECISREVQLQTVFNRLRNAESTAIVGEPHVGKTSFLFQIENSKIQSEYLNGEDKKMCFVNLDLHSIEDNYNSSRFWADVLSGLTKLRTQSIETLVDKATKSQYNRHLLEMLFAKLASQNRLLVLLLDEFERLLKHPNFKDPSFFALLRSLSTRTGGLAIVLASRMSVGGLNQVGRELLDAGSPFFNNMIDLRLPVFNDKEINSLLAKAQPAFSNDEKKFIYLVAGRNPFLLQAMAGISHETELSSFCSETTAEVFYKRTSQYFDDLWNYLDDDTRTIAVILSIQDIGGRFFGTDFSYGEIERIDRFGLELQKLEEHGLAEKIDKTTKGWVWDSKSLLLWRGERWRISCAAFSWWIRDVVISPSRSIPTYNDWLIQKKYIGLLTQKQWDDSQKLLKMLPSTMINGVGGLARSLWNEIVKVK